MDPGGLAQCAIHGYISYNGGLAQCAIHGYISYNGYGGDDDAGDDDAGDDGDSKGCSHTASLSLVRCIFVWRHVRAEIRGDVRG